MTKITIEFTTDDIERADRFIQAIELIATTTFEDADITHGDPTPEDCLRIARNNGYVVKAWQRDDIEGRWGDLEDDYPELKDIDPQTRAHVIDQAADSGYFSNLADCTDGDWIAVDMAIGEGLSLEKIEIRGLS